MIISFTYINIPQYHFIFLSSTLHDFNILLRIVYRSILLSLVCSWQILVRYYYDYFVQSSTIQHDNGNVNINEYM